MNKLEAQLAKAVKYFWQVRNRQNKRQGKVSGTRDKGNRAAVTGGGHCNGFANLIRAILIVNGVQDAHVFHKREKPELDCEPSPRSKGTQLPGYFRSTKEWDLVVVVDGQLLASLEFKSHIGPSFGNNFNNRTEEALGSATDILTAYREGAFKPSIRPWLGYFMLLEDAPSSATPVKVKQPHFNVFPEFIDSSYQKRYELFCQRLVRENLYDAACLILSNNVAGRKGGYSEPNPELSFQNFVESLSARAIAAARKQQQSKS